jgi:hypothetical protein
VPIVKVPCSPLIVVALLPTACSSSRPTSSAEVKAALSSCGIGDQELLWIVDDKGTFLSGRQASETPPLPPAKEDCLMKWIDEKNVRTVAIGATV